ncbi:MAG: hypothetical protein Kow00108_08670 [Calditrichia bacterium]
MQSDIQQITLFKEKSPAWIASYIFNKYLRVYPSEPLDVLIEKIRNKPFLERIQEAKSSIFPEVLLALSKDIDMNVREEVYKNEFWLLVGRNYEIIDFPKLEKLKLIEDENLYVLLTFLLFEKDLEVIRKVLDHPLLSIQILIEFEKILKQRGFGLEDQKLLQLVQEVIKERKDRFHKVSQIHSAKLSSEPSGIYKLLEFLLDSDSVIKQSALNALQSMSTKSLLQALSNYTAILEYFNEKTEKFVDILETLYKDFKPPIQITELFKEENIGDKASKIEETWKQVVIKIGQQFLQRLETELADYHNLQAIVKAHLSSLTEIRKIAASILSIEEIFALIEDEHFPKSISKLIVADLQKHPSPDVKSQVEAFYFKESERLRKKLKEMEISINAYFDIIFDMLGYPKIYEIRQKLKLLDQAFRLFEEYFARMQKSDFTAKKGFFQIYHGLIKDYQFQLEKIYKDISDKSLSEIEDLYEMLTLIFDVKDSFIEEEVKQDATHGSGTEDLKMIKQAELIWKSSISQYLGRIKELDDMLRHKWIFMLSKNEGEDSSNELKEEIKQVIQDMEIEHKSKIKCNLPITCRVCQKRNCASERFINQVEFFTSEFIQYIKSASENNE